MRKAVSLVALGCVVGLLVGLMVGVPIGSYNKDASKKAGVELAVLMKQMDRFASDKTVYVATSDRYAYATAAAEAFIAHGASYASKATQADFVFATDGRNRLGYEDLMIEDKSGNILYSAYVGTTDRARWEGLMFLEVLSRGGSVANQLAQKN